ncbi:MAG TPA: ABC transporter ATP-binding protein [Gemmatimonadaceae bacterium]|nr:ABC transporter ATP-binding protein [Gemmatimonadaceae bacterium]
MSLLELRELSRRFGDFVALDSVNLSVQSGEFLTVLGASGSGKTTTLRLIAGFDRPTSGSILMDGTDLAPLPPFRRPVNTVFQHYALFPHMSVRDNVGYGLRMQKVAPAEIGRRVDEALAMVRLDDFGGRAPKQLSGGQQQRVALARALVNRPRVLLLDEPLGALDLKLRREMQLELKQLQTQVGITFIYVTHDQEEALTMSDRIVLMRAGRIEQIGTPREMYDSPRSRYVADFIGDTNLLRLGNDEVSVRPEHVQLIAADGGGMPGLVDAVTFVGSSYRVRVALADGQRVVALQSAPREIGQRVAVQWDPSRGVIVRD